MTQQVPAGRRVRRVLSTRAGGASVAPYDSFNLGTHVGDDPHAVAANRSRLAQAIGVADGDLVWMEQVHGRGVQRVDGPVAGPIDMTDGLVTSTPSVVLNVLTADCVPVLLWDEEAGVVGAAHAGRQGVRLGVVTETVAAMLELGATSESIEVLLGPAICGSCYEVPEQMQRDVEAHAAGSAVRTREGTPGLDLHAGLISQLAAIGVTRVQSDARCTFEDDTLFSYRRAQQTGRQTAAIWIERS